MEDIVEVEEWEVEPRPLLIDPFGQRLRSSAEKAQSGSTVDMNELWLIFTPHSPISQFHPPSGSWVLTRNSNISWTRGSCPYPKTARVRAILPVTQGSQRIG